MANYVLVELPQESYEQAKELSRNGASDYQLAEDGNPRDVTVAEYLSEILVDAIEHAAERERQAARVERNADRLRPIVEDRKERARKAREGLSIKRDPKEEQERIRRAETAKEELTRKSANENQRDRPHLPEKWRSRR